MIHPDQAAAAFTGRFQTDDHQSAEVRQSRLQKTDGSVKVLHNLTSPLVRHPPPPPPPARLRQVGKVTASSLKPIKL